MSNNPTGAVLQRATKAKGLRGRAPGAPDPAPEPTPTPEAVPAPVAVTTATPSVEAEPASASELLNRSGAGEASPVAKRPARTAKTEPKARPQTEPRSGSVTGGVRAPVRRNLSAAIDAELHNAWMARLEKAGITWRGDALGAAVRALFSKTDPQVASAVLAEGARGRAATIQIGGRVAEDLYHEFYKRLDEIGRLPRGSALGAALRAALHLTDKELVAAILKERRGQ